MTRLSKHIKRAGLITICVLLDISISYAQQRLSNDCRVVDADKRVSAYKIGRIFPVVDNVHASSMIISVEQQQFIRSDMIALARRINCDYSDRAKFVVYILDDYNIASTLLPVGGAYTTFERARRGTYFIDRSTGEEYIEFSTTRKKPKNEIRINLGRVLRK